MLTNHNQCIIYKRKGRSEKHILGLKSCEKLNCRSQDEQERITEHGQWSKDALFYVKIYLLFLLFSYSFNSYKALFTRFHYMIVMTYRIKTVLPKKKIKFVFLKKIWESNCIHKCVFCIFVQANKNRWELNIQPADMLFFVGRRSTNSNVS